MKNRIYFHKIYYFKIIYHKIQANSVYIYIYIYYINIDLRVKVVRETSFFLNFSLMYSWYGLFEVLNISSGKKLCRCFISIIVLPDLFK